MGETLHLNIGGLSIPLAGGSIVGDVFGLDTWLLDLISMRTSEEFTRDGGNTPPEHRE